MHWNLQYIRQLWVLNCRKKLKGKWQLLSYLWHVIVWLSKSNSWKFGVHATLHSWTGAPVICQFAERGITSACEKRNYFCTYLHSDVTSHIIIHSLRQPGHPFEVTWCICFIDVTVVKADASDSRENGNEWHDHDNTMIIHYSGTVIARDFKFSGQILCFPTILACKVLYSSVLSDICPLKGVNSRV